jgi:hypothetical protein
MTSPFKEIKTSTNPSKLFKSQCFDVNNGCLIYQMMESENCYEIREILLSENDHGKAEFTMKLRQELPSIKKGSLSDVFFDRINRSVVILQGTTVMTIHLASNALSSSISTRDFDSQYGISCVSLQYNHVAFAGKSKSSKGTLISLSETTYGTLQNSLTLPHQFDSMALNEFKTQDIGVGLFVSGVSVQGSKVDIHVFTIPYHVEPISLCQSLGMKKNDLDYLVTECSLNFLKLEDLKAEKIDSLNAKQKSDAEFLTKFLNATDETTCSKLFKQWVNSKNMKLLSSDYVSLLLNHMVDSKIWSRDELLQIITNVSVKCTPQLIAFVIEKQDLEVMCLILENLEMDEKVLVACLHYSLQRQILPFNRIIEQVFSKEVRHDHMVSNLKSLQNAEIEKLLSYALATFHQNYILVYILYITI